MKSILITGASGFLGSNMVKNLLTQGHHVIAILGRPEDKANILPSDNNLEVFPCSCVFSTDFGHVDTLIHAAFSRGSNMMGLTASIEFSRRIIELVNQQQIDSIINISTQGLYKGVKPGEIVSEDGVIGPNTAYGLAKWSVENMLKIGCSKPFTNIRLASLSANARFLDFFVDSVIARQEIIVTAPRQYASIMDISDAINGILSIERIPISQRNTVYNLGPSEQYSILDYAQMVNDIGIQFGFHPVPITINDQGNDFAICMNCERTESQTSWKPCVSKDMMIARLYQHKVNGKHS